MHRPLAEALRRASWCSWQTPLRWWLPGHRPDAVQHVAAQFVAGGYAGMVEIAVEIAPHAEPFHHAARGRVDRGGVGNDFPQSQPRETVIHRGARGFAGEAAAPERRSERPHRLDCRRHRIGLRHGGEPDEADERRLARHLDGPNTKTVAIEMG